MLKLLLLTAPLATIAAGAGHAAGGGAAVLPGFTAHPPVIRVADAAVTVEISDRATLEMPAGSKILTERQTDQGVMTATNTIIEVPLTKDEAMTLIEDALKDAGERPDVIRTGDLSAINIVESSFRLGIAFEVVSDESTIVMVSVFEQN
jgi:hypothetical protein